MSALARQSGILLPLSSLRTRTDFGMGDFGGLDGLFEWMGTARQRMLMVLPLVPTGRLDPSPYGTHSAFGLNPLFIDLSSLDLFHEAGGFSLLSAAERSELERLRATPRMDYPGVASLKRAVLRRVFDHFLERDVGPKSPRAAALERYQDTEARWLSPYALFWALWQREGFRPWWEWPGPLRDREPSALAQAQSELADEVRFQGFLQWVAEEQWAAVRANARRRGILLCGDEPFIVGPDSADAWSFPQLLRRDARLGVPPDDFSADGQDWGLPYFDFPAMEREGYGWLRFRAKKAAAYYDVRRVDHAVGYFRQWLRDAGNPRGHFVPADEAAQRSLGETHFRLLAEHAGIIAEDLGVIPPFVRETLDRLQIPGYRVMRWERFDGRYKNPHQYPKLSLATTGTHDTQTLREWWETAPPWEREGVCGVFPELEGQSPGPEWTDALHRSLLRAALGASSDLCILPWQDVLGTRDRINLPGSVSEANWTYRIAQCAEELVDDPVTKHAAEELRALTQEAGR